MTLLSLSAMNRVTLLSSQIIDQLNPQAQGQAQQHGETCLKNETKIF